MTVQKKNWIITGISSGFGKLLAAEVMKNNDFVIGTFRSETQVKEFNRLYANKGIAFKLDVTFPEQVSAFYQTLSHQFDHIDVLVNNAGYGLVGAIEEVSLEEARIQMETNFFGALNMTQHVLPILRQQRSGHIVQISSVAGFAAIPGAGLYNASKFALEGFSEALALEMQPFNIKVTIVEPGPFRTEFCGAALKTASRKIAAYEDTVGSIIEQIHHQHGKQIGDPQKGVLAILKAVNSKNPPLRLPLGKIAIERINAKLDQFHQDLASWKEVVFDTEFEDVEADVSI